MHIRRGAEFQIGLIALLFFAAIAVYVVIRVLPFGAPPALVTAALTVASALVVQAMTSASQRRREIEADQRKEKAQVYEAFMTLWFDDMMLPGLLEKNRADKAGRVQDDLIRKMGNFTKKAILWGSDDVVKEYSSYRKMLTGQTASDPKPLDPKLAGLERLFFAFRKDLGYRNRGLAQRDLLALFINDLHEPTAGSIPLSASDEPPSLPSGRNGSPEVPRVANRQQRRTRR